VQVPEKLGAFYLGREIDPATGARAEAPLLLDANDFCTHAVCVGMTGSGKTGLGIALLEEAAIDGVPAIVIDPKGDLGNLLLGFPALAPADFAPWVDPDAARRKGIALEQLAAETAASWRQGLADWGQDGERIARLRAAVELRLYTPGSDAGLPVSILASLAAPAGASGEALRDQVRGTVSALLGLVGIDADPLQSREHILLATLLERAWAAGESLGLERLIGLIQTPDLDRVGVFDLETFFPAKERFTLAMAFNALLASPSFAAWMQGEPLDPARLLAAPDGRPRLSIFSIAHLSESERMVFVTLLLEQLLAWQRRQAGTASLRALLYVDELFGYLPPVAEPPSKRPLLTLLKQARAAGLGIVLCTQNPVDLDYKALSNAGTWFIGKLQTERDRARLLDGLDSASAGAAGWDRARADQLIAGLGGRQFLLHSVHAKAPRLFASRWALSYLAGPLTREQIRRLVPAASAAPAPGGGSATAPAAAAPSAGTLASAPPALPPGRSQCFLPLRVTAQSAALAIGRRSGAAVDEAAARLVWEPGLLGLGTLSFVDARRGIDEPRRLGLLLPAAALEPVADWAAALPVGLAPSELVLEAPSTPGAFAPLPAPHTKTVFLNAQARAFKDRLARGERMSVFSCPPLKLASEPGEDEAAFRARVRQAARERRDEDVAKLGETASLAIQRLQTRLEREERELGEDRADYESRKREELLAAGETLAGMLGIFGSRRRSLSTAATKRRMTGRAREDIAESEAEIARLRAEIDALEAKLNADAAAIATRWDAAQEQVLARELAPRKSELSVDWLELAWAPVWDFGAAGRLPAWREEGAA